MEPPIRSRLDENRNVIPCKTWEEFRQWHNSIDPETKTGMGQRVKRTEIGNVLVSTVFVGIDLAFFESTPMMFESLVFGGDNDGYCEHYATWQDAENGHQRIVDEIKTTPAIGQVI